MVLRQKIVCGQGFIPSSTKWQHVTEKRKKIYFFWWPGINSFTGQAFILPISMLRVLNWLGSDHSEPVPWLNAPDWQQNPTANQAKPGEHSPAAFIKQQYLAWQLAYWSQVVLSSNSVGALCHGKRAHGTHCTSSVLLVSPASSCWVAEQSSRVGKMKSAVINLSHLVALGRSCNGTVLCVGSPFQWIRPVNNVPFPKFSWQCLTWHSECLKNYSSALLDLSSRNASAQILEFRLTLKPRSSVSRMWRFKSWSDYFRIILGK